MPWSPAPRPCRSAGSAGAVAASTRRSAARAGGGTPGAGPGASPRRAPPPLAERAAGLLGRLVRPAMLQVRPLLLGAHLGALERVLENGLRLGARVRAAHHLLLGQQLRTGAQLLAVVRRFLPRPTAGLLVAHGTLLPPGPGRYPAADRRRVLGLRRGCPRRRRAARRGRRRRGGQHGGELRVVGLLPGAARGRPAP